MKLHLIDTAPKDGTEVIVAVEIATVWVLRNARYVRAEDWMPELDPLYPWRAEEEEDTDGWWAVRNSVTQEFLEGYYEPTHWMPMPELPEDSNDQNTVKEKTCGKSPSHILPEMRRD